MCTQLVLDSLNPKQSHLRGVAKQLGEETYSLRRNDGFSPVDSCGTLRYV